MQYLAHATILVLALGPAATSAEAGATQEAAAVVCLVEGSATAVDPGETDERPVRLLSVVTAGTEVRTSEHGSLVIALADGRRFSIGSAASAVIGTDGVTAEAGEVRALPAVPALPRLARIAAGEQIGERSAAGRIRKAGSDEERELILDPASGLLVLAEDLTLSFEPLEGYQTYRLSVEKAWGRTVLEITTRSPSVAVPAGTLEAGATYHWHVQTLDPERPGVRGGAVFFTLGEDEARARAEIAAQVHASDDPSLLVLLAGVDRHLGLEREACRELRAASSRLEDSSQVAEMLRTFECAPPRP